MDKSLFLGNLLSRAFIFKEAMTISNSIQLDEFIKLNSSFSTSSTTDISTTTTTEEEEEEEIDMGGSLRIYVKALNGNTYTIYADPVCSIEYFKKKIEKRCGIEVEQQRLIFDGKQIDDGHILCDYNIKTESEVRVALRLRGGGCKKEMLSLDKEFLDPKYDYDFTNIVDNHKFFRGNREYKRPCGWKRYALKVSGKYDNGNDTWLGCNNSKGEWPVAYHGTRHMNIQPIAKEGLKTGIRNAYGVGIYCTPNIDTASCYSPTFEYEGERYKVVLQTRVNPNVIVECKAKGGPEDYWFVPQGDYIRSYSICVKKIE